MMIAESIFEKFILFKLHILNEIEASGNEGIFQTKLYEMLAEYNYYDFSEGLTASKLIESLHNSNEIYLKAINPFEEMKYFTTKKLKGHKLK